MATPHFSFCAPPVEQPANGREPLQRTRPDLIDAFRSKAGLAGCHEATMVRLCDVGQRRRAAVIKPSFGQCMEIGNMVCELVHQKYAQPARLGEGVEQ